MECFVGLLFYRFVLPILVTRYPVILREFSLRTGSGGGGGSDGKSGGDGVIRRVQFRRDGMTVSLLSERRSRAPPGRNPF